MRRLIGDRPLTEAEKSARYRAKNRDRINERKRQRAAELREKGIRPGYLKNSALKHHYGITLDDYNRMFERQKGRCAICGKHQSKLEKSLVVDHDHDTNEVRGLLCHHCNLVLGHAKDDVRVLSNAAAYLMNGGAR
jgi:hypothetical protein